MRRTHRRASLGVTCFAVMAVIGLVSPALGEPKSELKSDAAKSRQAVKSRDGAKAGEAAPKGDAAKANDAATANGTAKAPSESQRPGDAHASSASDAQQYCTNVAALAQTARAMRQERRLAELESQLTRRMTELEAKRKELQDLLDRYDTLIRNADESIVAIYGRMRPDAAAAQLASMDEDAAAALLLRIQPKKSSAILNEMDPQQAALLTRKITAMALLSRGGAKQ